MKRFPLLCAGLALAVSSALSCGGESESDSTPTTDASMASATTVGAAVQQLAGVGFEALEPIPLAVEFDDGTEATASASVSILEDVGLGPDVLNQSPITLVTWGGQYLIVEDEVPDRVLLEETSDGQWAAVSVEG